MRSTVTDGVAWSVSVSVCLLITFMNPTKTAELFQMPFGWVTRFGPGNHVLDGSRFLEEKRQFFWVVRPIETHCELLLWCYTQQKDTITTSARLLKPTACFAPDWSVSH